MLLTDEQLETIEKLSGAGYGPLQVAMYLDLPKKLFMKAWHDAESAIRYHYDRGILLVDAQAGIKLSENAMGGNITAHQQLEKVRRGQRLVALKKRIIYGEEID